MREEGGQGKMARKKGNAVPETGKKKRDLNLLPSTRV